jgi:hypothetical protein
MLRCPKTIVSKTQTEKTLQIKQPAFLAEERTDKRKGWEHWGITRLKT